MAYRMPDFNLTCAVWHFGSDPATDPPDDFILGNLCVGRRGYPGDVNLDPFDAAKLPNLYLLFPFDYVLLGDIDNAGAYDIVETGAGDGFFWKVHWQHPVALGFANQHKRAIVIPYLGASPPPPTGFILLETGDFILLETGDKILLE